MDEMRMRQRRKTRHTDKASHAYRAPRLKCLRDMHSTIKSQHVSGPTLEQDILPSSLALLCEIADVFFSSC